VVVSSIDPRMKTKQSKTTSPEMGEVAHPGGAGYRMGPWTEQEVLKLVWFVRLFGERRWDFLAKVSGLQGGG
jgi:myb proto-oncogene protein